MIQDQILELLKESIAVAYPDLDTSLVEVTVTVPNNKDHGDFASTIALQLAKHLNQAPLAIAEQIVSHVDPGTIVEHISVLAPGFINFRVSAEYLTAQLFHFSCAPLRHRDETVLIEYSSPNIAKEMHIGHLLTTTIYGEAMKRIHQFLGYHVIADNHLGDMGTQFGKVIYGLKHYSSQKELEQDPIANITELYVKFHEEAEKNPELLDAAREESKKLEEGDKENTELWQWICDISLKDFNDMYQLLDVSFDTMLGESFYVPQQKQYVEELLEQKIATQNPDGSIGVVFEEHGLELPSMPIMRADGGSLYITRDIATIKYRLDTYQPHKMIYVVGAEQSLHFQQLFAIARLLGWDTCQYEHMSYGLFRLKEGKMSTRKGKTILAKDVIEEGRKRVRALLIERGMEEALIEELVDPIAIGAIKYSNFYRNRNTQSVFDWDTSLSFEGNSGPYLQYTYARSLSILEKAKETVDLQPIFDGHEMEDYLLESEVERQLMLQLLAFEEAVEGAGRMLQMNILAQYLYDLASTFNRFYGQIKVIIPEEEAAMHARLRLVHATSTVLRTGLELLSIPTPERM